MKLVIGLLFICFGLVAALPFLPIPKSDPAKKPQFADSSPHDNPYLTKESAQKESVEKSKKTFGDAMAKSLFKIDTEAMKNIGNNSGKPATVENEFAKPQKKSPIEITAFPGARKTPKNNGDKWAGNKFLTPASQPTEDKTSSKPVVLTKTSTPFQSVVNPMVKTAASSSPAVTDSHLDSNGKFSIPEDWHEFSASRQQQSSLVGNSAPDLKTIQWSTEPKKDAKAKLIIFWATWGDDNEQTVLQHNQWFEQFSSAGLDVLGVCDSVDSENMADAIQKFKIKYPVAADQDHATTHSFHVNRFPSYYLIDAAGNVRAANLRTDKVEAAVKALLAE
jgi:peroxiredoxin